MLLPFLVATAAVGLLALVGIKGGPLTRAALVGAIGGTAATLGLLAALGSNPLQTSNRVTYHDGYVAITSEDSLCLSRTDDTQGDGSPHLCAEYTEDLLGTVPAVGSRIRLGVASYQPPNGSGKTVAVYLAHIE